MVPKHDRAGIAAIDAGTGAHGRHATPNLVVADRLPERLVLLRVFERFGQRRSADAERLRGDGDASALESEAGHREALARRPQQLVRVDADVGEIEIHAAEAADAEGIGAGPALDG